MAWKFVVPSRISRLWQIEGMNALQIKNVGGVSLSPPPSTFDHGALLNDAAPENAGYSMANDKCLRQPPVSCTVHISRQNAVKAGARIAMHKRQKEKACPA